MATVLKDVIKLGLLSKIEYIEELQKWGLLSIEKKCPKCQFGMVLEEKKGLSDGYSWRCNRSGCKVVTPIRKGTWFENSKLSLQQIMLLSYTWCLKYTHQHVVHEVGVSEQTVADWFNFCRELTVEFVEQNSEPIGGPGKNVLVCESLFSKRGKKKESQQWVFGGVEQEGPKCFLVKTDDWDATTILNLITNYVLPGSTIHVDSYKAYQSLGGEGYQFLTVNHSVTFVCGDEHANKTEGLWVHVKRSFPAFTRNKNYFDSYLAEFMWRRLRSTSPCVFKAFLVDAYRLYLPN